MFGQMNKIRGFACAFGPYPAKKQKLFQKKGLQNP